MTEVRLYNVRRSPSRSQALCGVDEAGEPYYTEEVFSIGSDEYRGLYGTLYKVVSWAPEAKGYQDGKNS